MPNFSLQPWEGTWYKGSQEVPANMRMWHLEPYAPPDTHNLFLCKWKFSFVTAFPYLCIEWMGKFVSP